MDKKHMWEFTVRFLGVGETPDEAWIDVCETVTLDFGYMPTNEARDISLVEEGVGSDE